MTPLRIAAALLTLLVLAACEGGGEPDATTPDASMPDAAAPDTSVPPDAGECPTAATPAPGLVFTDRGPVQGVQLDQTWAYLGIPYAAPPVADLRWSPPVTHACWSDPLDASAFGARCMQLDHGSPQAPIGSEDCLTANVWAPADATPSSALPVIAYVHGGANYEGGSADQWVAGTYVYDGAALAAKAHAVVVTFNYRLGALGFLAHTSFGAGSGNYALLDQIAALRWVEQNVAAFGGDPAHVLVAGSSAGAEDVCALVASRRASGLFSAALMSSGTCMVAQSAADAHAFADTFAHTVGCDTAPDPAVCLRALDAGAVTLAVPWVRGTLTSPSPQLYEANVDGDVLTGVPIDVIASGAHNHVPFAIGSNSDETSGEIFDAFPHGMTPAQLDAIVLAFAGGDRATADRILALYPLGDYGGDARAAAIAGSTDASMGCTVRYIARTIAGAQTEPVARYYFTHALHDPRQAPRGAWHGMDVVFFFQHLSSLVATGYWASPEEHALADAMDGYGSALAASGDPNGGGRPAWPPYDAASDPYLRLDETITPGAGLHTAQCDFWDDHYRR